MLSKYVKAHSSQSSLHEHFFRIDELILAPLEAYVNLMVKLIYLVSDLFKTENLKQFNTGQ